MLTQTITKNNGVIVETAEKISGTTNDNVKKLETLIAVYNQGAVIMKTGMAIKMTALAIIDYTNLYSEKGYENIIDFASKELKLSAQTARRYLQTAKKFYDIENLANNFNVNDLLDEKGNFKKISTFKIKSILANDKGDDFTPTTLNDIAALPVNTVKQLLSDNTITYDMTGNEIKSAVAPYRKSSKKAARQAVKISGTTNNETTTENVIVTNNDNSEIDFKAQIALLQAEKAKLEKEVAELKNKIKVMEENNKSSIENLQTENDTLIAENETLQAENVKLKNSNNSYKSANSKAKNTIATLKSALDTLQGANENKDTVNEEDTPVTIEGALI